MASDFGQIMRGRFVTINTQSGAILIELTLVRIGQRWKRRKRSEVHSWCSAVVTTCVKEKDGPAEFSRNTKTP